MSRRRESRPAAALELKSVRLTGIQVILHSAEHAALANHIDTLFSPSPDFFGGEAAVFDCARLAADAPAPDWAWLAGELQSRGLHPYAVKNATPAIARAAQAAGLAVLGDSGPARPVPAEALLPEPAAEEAAPEPEPADAAGSAPPPAPAAAPTLIVDKPLRSGQRVYAQGGDLVVLAVVNPGAEVIADGSIHVYAPLKGRALAGAKGDTAARIFTSRFEAELVSIAGVYRTLDGAPDAAVANRPAQIRLTDAGALLVEPL